MTDNKPLRVAIWCAVSSKPQAAEDKSSLADQEAAGRQFAEALNGVVVRVYQVPGNTRDIIFWDEAEREMEAYRQLRLDAQAGAFDVLHATDPDRIGRDPALANQVVSLVDKSGAEVYFASNPHVIGQRSAGQRYVFAIQSTRAQEDQLRRVEYRRRGMNARVKRGLHPSNWPYGYEPIYDGGKVIGAQFSPDAGAVRLATERFLAGDTYNQIGRVLDASPYRPQRTSPWDKAVVRDMLQNDLYAGLVVYNGETFTSDRFPAIWDEATHAAVIRERKRRENARGRRTHCALNHIAFCDRCGAPMHRADAGHLRCAGQRARGDCATGTIREREIQDAIVQFLRGMTEESLLESLIESQDGSRTALQDELRAIAGEISQLEGQRTRMALAFAAAKMEIDVYQVADQTLRDQIAYRRERERVCRQQITVLPDVAQRRQAIAALKARIPELFSLPALEANTLLRDAGIHVYCRDHRVVRITTAGMC